MCGASPGHLHPGPHISVYSPASPDGVLLKWQHAALRRTPTLEHETVPAFYPASATHQTAKSVTCAGQGPSPSGHLRPESASVPTRPLTYRSPALIVFNRRSAICFSPSIQNVSYHVPVHIIIALTAHLSCILFVSA